MADKIKMRRGELPDLPTLDSGEFGLATDAENLYIGSPTGNVLINPVKLDGDAYQIDAYLNPTTDNVHGLGTPSKRWRHVVVGPGSFYIVDDSSEMGGTGRSYSLGISESGNLSIKESGSTVFTVTPSGTSSSAYTRILVSDGYASSPAFSFTDDTDTGLYRSASNELSASVGSNRKLKISNEGLSIIGGVLSIEKSTAPSATDGYGKLYVQSDGYLYYKDFSGAQTNILSGSGSGTLSVTNGTDGYVAFFTSSNSLSGKSNLYWDSNNDRLGINTASPAESLDISGNIAVSGEIYNTVLQNILDGYALVSTENQRWADSATQRQDIRNALDGYASGNTGDIINALDGYALKTTENQRWSESTSQRQDIRNSLDGYALSVTENQRWTDSATQRQDIRDALDGYALRTVENLRWGESADQRQNIRNSLDGYSLLSTENSHWIEGVTQRQDIRDSLDGYSTLTTAEGADGYIAFFTGSNSMAGDNDLFYNRATGDLTLGSGGQILVGNNSNTKPPYSFASDPNTGMYWVSSGFFRLVSNNASKITITSSSVSIDNGGSFNLQTAYLNSSSDLVKIGSNATTSHSLSTGNTIVGTDLEVDGYTYLDSGVAVAGNAGVSGDLTVSSDLSVDGYSYLSGFSSDGNAGVTGNFDVTGDIESAGDLTVAGAFLAGDGSATYPSISFSNKPFTGLYITQPAGFLGISVAATTQALFAASEVQLNNWYDIMLSNGFIYDSSRALTLGTELTTSHDLSSGDVLVGGDLEVDGYAYFDGGLGVEGNVGVTGDFDIDGNLTVDGLTVNDGYITSGTGSMQLGDTVGVDRNPTLYKLEVQGHAGKTDGGTSWATISDITEKKDISKLSNSLDRLTKLSGVLYRWINPEDHGTTEAENILRAGFIAQEVCEYFPEWVKEDINGKKWLDMIGFEAYVVESIKQIKDQFDNYDKRLSAIEKKINGD